MHSGPGVGSDNIWGQPGWAPGVGWSRCGLRAGRGRLVRRLLAGRSPAGHLSRDAPRPCAAPGSCPVRSTSAARGHWSASPDEGRVLCGGSPSPTRGSPFPAPLSHAATSRHPDDSPSLDLSAGFFVFPPGTSRPEVRSTWTPSPGALGRRYHQVRHQPSGRGRARPAPRALSAGASSAHPGALCARVRYFQLSRFLRIAFFFPFLDYW